MIRIMLILFICTLLGACGQHAPGTPEDAAEVAFEALQNDDFEGYDPLLLTEADVDWMLDKVEGFETGDEIGTSRKQLENEGGAEKAVEKAREECQRCFDVARDASEGDFDWSSAEFGEFDESRMKARARRGMEFTEIYFDVKAGGRVYEFYLSASFKTARGWICGSGIRYRGRKW